MAGLPEAAAFNLARGRARLGVRRAFQDLLEARGVRFLEPGVVVAADGRLAPTRKGTGKMTGRRLTRARNALGLDQHEVAALAGVSTSTVARLEGCGRVHLTRSAYAIVGALQLAGYGFASEARRDKALVARRKRRASAADRDLPIEWLGVGLGVRGDLELEAENVVPLKHRKRVTR